MSDMLVKLYTLPPLEPLVAAVEAKGVILRRALAPEKHLVLDWIEAHFDAHYRSEADVAFAHQPISCFIATTAEGPHQMLGFAVYEATAKGFFGPTGVAESERGRGIGKALLLMSLHAMRAEGYAYGIIGWVGPAEFYAASVGATLIPDSKPGIYRGMLRS